MDRSQVGEEVAVGPRDNFGPSNRTTTSRFVPKRVRPYKTLFVRLECHNPPLHRQLEQRGLQPGIDDGADSVGAPGFRFDFNFSLFVIGVTEGCITPWVPRWWGRLGENHRSLPAALQAARSHHRLYIIRTACRVA
eukprot:1357373-Amorphochlora_amoeboformis.AAC.1